MIIGRELTSRLPLLKSLTVAFLSEVNLVGTHGIYAGETKILCTPKSGTVDSDAVIWSMDGTAIEAGDKYVIATRVDDTFTLTIRNTASSDAADYKCSYDGQMGFYTLEASSIQGKIARLMFF